MVSKFGKEKKLFQTNSFRVKYGTINAVILKAIYINIESWVQPTEILNFDSTVRLIRNDIIRELEKSINNDFFSKNLIVDLDLRASGMSIDKKSFMSIEITIYPKSFVKFNSTELVNNIKEITSTTIEVVKKNKFIFYSKKK